MLCDLDALETLPRADLVAGLAEVVKCGFIADPRILELVEADPAAAPTRATGRTSPSSSSGRSRVKADVVGEDLKEAGLREILNYGHTFGHAIEQVERYQWRHGAAVAVGMVFAAELAARCRAPRRRRRRPAPRDPVVGSACRSYRGDRWDELLAAMRRDKKTRGDLLRFVVLEDVGEPARASRARTTAWLRDAFHAISS